MNENFNFTDLIGWAFAVFVVFVLGAIIGVIIYSAIKTVRDANKSRLEENNRLAHENVRSIEGEY